jgi:hypothetical protein
MADTHEEQLLNGLLDEIARQDAALDASHLEARVLEAVSDDSHTNSSPWRVWVALPLAAALMLVLAATIVRRHSGPAPAAAPTLETTVAIEQTPGAAVPQKPKPVRNSSPRVRSVRPQPDQSEQIHPNIQQDPGPQQPSAVETTAADSPLEFVPLLPMTEQELTGSFQIVRVQMPNASLGPLRSPLQSPNDLVEADVLLGEDGRARAIRLNTNGSIYPWRSR